ncbi:putative transposase [Variovorax paradoxus B4]|uniref:Putative transposase n=1 Tax=Variovorax paradoxus B4 TaxID=1246301 RepID=T1X883_VARPD|nr:putative transposase [Variovorax paradoxus B4]
MRQAAQQSNLPTRSPSRLFAAASDRCGHPQTFTDACLASRGRLCLDGHRHERRRQPGGVRVRAAHREHLRMQQRVQEWLLIEWPEGHKEPMKYWLSTLAEDLPLERMVLEAKMRWRIERDYQDLKQELGLGHYEGRGWRGFHHHASLSIAAYGFLMARQLRHPEGAGKKKLRTKQRICPAHALQASRQPSARSATCHRPSRLCGCLSPQPCSRRCPDVRAACAKTQGYACDTVRIGLLLRHSAHWPDLSVVIEVAIRSVLRQDYRTADIRCSSTRLVGTERMGDLIADAVGSGSRPAATEH